MGIDACIRGKLPRTSVKWPTWVSPHCDYTSVGYQPTCSGVLNTGNAFYSTRKQLILGHAQLVYLYRSSEGLVSAFSSSYFDYNTGNTGKAWQLSHVIYMTFNVIKGMKFINPDFVVCIAYRCAA